jgi:hypothetical protein
MTSSLDLHPCDVSQLVDGRAPNESASRTKTAGTNSSRNFAVHGRKSTKALSRQVATPSASAAPRAGEAQRARHKSATTRRPLVDRGLHLHSRGHRCLSRAVSLRRVRSNCFRNFASEFTRGPPAHWPIPPLAHRHAPSERAPAPTQLASASSRLDFRVIVSNSPFYIRYYLNA